MSLDGGRLGLALRQAATLGECLQWHAASGRWWWTDIESSTLHAWTPGADAILTCHLPDRAGSFAHTRSGGLLLALAKRIACASVHDLQACGEVALQVQDLAEVEPGLPSTRCNDGRCDRAGNFVFGTIDEARPRSAIGSFYQYSAAHGLRRLDLGGVAIANSICFSLDGRRMFFCDTLQRRIMQCDYDSDAAHVSHVRPFADITFPHAWPDGAVIASDGSLWSAQWGAGSVAQYSADGRELRRFHAPAKQTSCPAFGGPGLATLMVTTARQELSAEDLKAVPESGSLFGMAGAVDQGFCGVVEVLFADAA